MYDETSNWHTRASSGEPRPIMAITHKVTAEEFAQIDTPGRYDLIRGEIIRMPPTGGEHGEIMTELARHMANLVAGQQLGKVYSGDVGFTLAHDPDVVLCPDVAFVQADRLPPREERIGFLELAPDLAIEIISPSDRINDANDKVIEYLNAGTRLVWLVDPRRHAVTVYTSDRSARLLLEDDHLDGGDVLPGFHLVVDEIFQ